MIGMNETRLASDGAWTGRVYFIGAGPGDPDLITVRGRALIERCRVCLFAGSLVPREVVAFAPPGALVRNTASMDLDAIVGVMAEAAASGRDVARVARLRLGVRPHLRGQRAVQHHHLARLAVQLEEHLPPAVLVRVAHRQELDDQRLARLDVHADLLAGLHAEEERGRRQHAGVGVFVLVGGELGEDARVEQVRHHLALADGALELLLQLFARGGEIG